MRLVCLGLVLAGCADVSADNPFDPEAPPSVKARGTISGLVKAADGGSLAGGTVVLVGTSLTTAVECGDDGCSSATFRLTEVPEGTHALGIEADCYRRELLAGIDVPLGADVQLGSDGDEGFAIVLRPATGTILGRVETPDPSDVTEVLVAARGSRAAPDAEGRFRLDGARACGAQQVVARLPLHEPATSPVVELEADGVLELEEPLVLVARPGVLCGFVGLPGADLAAPPDDLEGCPTLAESGWPEARLEDTFVRILTVDGGEPSNPLAHNGYFRVSTDAGFHTVQLDRAGHRTVTRFNVPVDPDAPYSMGRVALEHAIGSLRGEVRLAGCPGSDAQVVVTATHKVGGDAQVALASVPGHNREGNEDCSAPGSWRFPEVRVGEYELTFNAADYREGRVEALVAEDAEGVAPAVELAFDPGALVGVVAPEGAQLGEPGCMEGGASGTDVVLDGTAWAATTDCTGAFELGDVRPGTYTLRISRQGETYVQHVVPTVTVTAGRRTDLGHFPLGYARGNLTGVVALEDGASPENVLVTANGPVDSAVAFANAQGAYSFFGLRVDDYTISASRDGYFRDDAEVGVVREADTDVRPLQLRVNPGRIAGWVAIPEAEAEFLSAGLAGQDLVSVAVGGDVECVPGDDCLPGYTCADEEEAPPCHQRPGYFSFDGVVRGSYTVRFAHQHGVYRATSLPNVIVEAGVTTRLDDVPLDFATGAARVTIAFEDVDPGAAQRPALMRRTRVDLFGRGVSYAGTPDPDTGVAEFPAVRVGDYTLFITQPDYELHQEQFTIERDGDVFERGAELGLSLAPNPGSITGTVVLEDPDDGAMANVRVDIPELEGFAAQGVDPDDGTFVLRPDALKTGVYSLVVTNPDGGYDAETVAPIAVVAGVPTNIGLVQLHYARASLSGRVVDAEGAGLPGAFVSLSGPGVVEPTLTNADGAFEFPSLRVGEYDVGVSLSCYETADRQDVVVDDSVDLGEIALEIDPGGFVGRLLDPTGAPVEDASVEASGTGVTTDSGGDGRFGLGGLACGDYSVGVTATGMRALSLLNQPVAPGADTDLGDVALEYARGDLRGSVATEDGDSAEGAVVQLDGPTEATTLTDDEGAYVFQAVRVGTYNVAVTLPAYRAGSAANQVVVEGETREVEEVVLDIDGGRILGRVVDEAGLPIQGVTIAAEVDIAQSGADGSFAFTGVKQGSYDLTLTLDGYAQGDERAVGVLAGSDTDLGDVRLIYARGSLRGTVDLEDTDDATGTVVSAVATFDPRLRYDALTDRDGDWSIDAVRVGQYTVTARAVNFVEEDEIVDVLDGEETPVDHDLALDRGCLTGQLVLSDGADDFTDARVENDQTSEVAVPDADGQFTFVDIAPGDYSFTVTYDGYADGGGFVSIFPGQECLNGQGGPRVVFALLDRTAPEAPVLELDACNTFEPLPGFAETPAYVKANDFEVAEDGRRIYSVYLTLDTEDADPLSDANFDPFGQPARGIWQVRINGGPWVGLQGGDAQQVADGACRGVPWLRLRTSRINELLDVEVRGIDADGNISDAGGIDLVLDPQRPPRVTVRAPQGCAPDPDDRVRTCYVADDVVNVSLDEAGGDPNFGCYYVLTRALEADEEVDLEADVEAADIDGFDTDTCLAPGTQLVSVLPTEAQRTLYCVRAFDQARRSSPMLDQGSAPGCVVLEKDTTEPSDLDLFPSSVPVRGETVQVFADLLDGDLRALEARLDRNFSHFEVRSALPGADFQPVLDDDDPFSLPLRLRGALNRVAVRAVDKAGNVSEAVNLSFVETSARTLVEDGRGVADAIDIDGTRVMWANPLFCDLEGGDDRGCRFQLLVDDASDLDEEPQVYVNAAFEMLTTCVVACPDDGTNGRRAAREVHFDLGSNGVVYTDYEELGGGHQNHLHHTYYWSFGADGAPAGADDTITALDDEADRTPHPVLDVATNEELVAFVRYLWSEDDTRYEVLAYKLDPTDAGSLDVDAVASIRVEAQIVELGLFRENVWYRTADGGLHLWALPTRDESVHATIELPAAMGDRVLGASWRDIDLHLAVERDGAHYLEKVRQIGSSRFWNADFDPAACACEDDQVCFGGACATWEADESTELSCSAQNDEGHCGFVSEFTGDGSTLAWVARESLLEDAQYRLISASIHLPDDVNRTRLQARVAPIEQPRLHLDRMVYLDSSTGTRRASAAEPSALSWSLVEADPRPVAYPKAANQWVVFSSTDGDQADGLYRVGLSGEGVAALPLGNADANTWGEGRGFDADGSTVVAAYRAGNNARRVYSMTLGFEDPNDDPSFVVQSRRVDVAVDEQTGAGAPSVRVAYSARTAGHDHGLRVRSGADLQTEQNLDDGQTPRDCDFVSFAGDYALCGGFIDPTAPTPASSVLVWYRFDRNTLDLLERVELHERCACPPNGDPCDQPCAAEMALGRGMLSAAHVTRMGEVIIELTDDEIRRIFRLSRGHDNRWGSNDDIGLELYNRLGEENGPIAVGADAIVFADERMAQQAEILRIRIADGSIDRLTTDDAAQIHPAINETGIYWVDERYTETAAGSRIDAPALTHRPYRR